MRSTHGVDVVLLHQRDVADHALAADDAPRLGIELVTVDALDGDRFAVH